MRAAVIVTMVMAALYGLHRLALYAEGRGWVYYRRARGRGAAAAALQAMSSILEPASEHVAVEQRRVRRDDHEDGDPPDEPVPPRPGSPHHPSVAD